MAYVSKQLGLKATAVGASAVAINSQQVHSSTCSCSVGQHKEPMGWRMCPNNATAVSASETAGKRAAPHVPASKNSWSTGQ